MSLLKTLLTTAFLLSQTTAAAASSGCGKDLPGGLSAGGSSVKFQLISGGIERVYRVYIPENYKKDVAAPMILSFHGNGGDTLKQEVVSDLSDPESNKDYVAVYPQGKGNSWQGAPYHNNTYNDLQFTTSLLTHLTTTLCIDPSRIYATGKSNGGGFVSLLACDSTLSSLIAAFAPVSGAFYPATYKPCKNSRKIPIMEFHGGADGTIPYGGENKNGEVLPGVLEYMKEWAGRDGCEKLDPTSVVEVKKGVFRNGWKCGGVEYVVHYYEETLGHSWPGTEQTGDELVPATPKILEFFGQWKL